MPRAIARVHGLRVIARLDIAHALAALSDA
jgi:hypothetical protein